MQLNGFTAGMIALGIGAGVYLALEPRLSVIDGDTVAIGKTHYRLVGFDTPELFHPRCEREFRLAQVARDRVRGLTASGNYSLSPVPCSCRPGTEDTPRCNWGRKCAVLRVEDRDIGDILIEEKLAQAYNYRWYAAPEKPQWCEQ